MSGSTDVLQVLLDSGAEVNLTNDEHASPLFFACQCNNQYAASVLLNRGLDVRLRNLQGLTAFDFIMDFDEWIECGYFTDEIRARLKAYSLKHTRDLIRAISKKVKSRPVVANHPNQARPSHSAVSSGYGSETRSLSRASHYSYAHIEASPRGAFTLPPLQRTQGFLTY